MKRDRTVIGLDRSYFRINRGITFIFLLTMSTTCLAQGGGVPIRVPDGAQSKCINGQTDAVWLTLRRFITERSKGWFTKDASVGIVINAGVRTYPVAQKPISFPLMAEASFENYPTGQVSLPIEYTIVDSLKLKSDIRYTGVDVGITLVNKKSANAWGVALQNLAQITKKLPIPSNPYMQAASYLLDFANTSLTSDLSNQNTQDKAVAASLALQFDPTGACADGQDFEKTGTIAVLQQEGAAGPGLIDINHTNDYCWTADLQPAFVLKAGKQIAGQSCASATGHSAYISVSNNYVAFVLNALPASSILGAVDKPNRDNALLRCSANGIAPQDCLKFAP